MSSPSGIPTMSVFTTPRNHKKATRPEQLIHKLGENRYIVNTNLNIDRRAAVRAYANEENRTVYFPSYAAAEETAKKVFEDLSEKPGLGDTSLISQAVWHDEPEAKSEAKSSQPETDQFVPSQARAYQRATRPEQLVHQIDDNIFIVNATMQAGDRAPIRAYTDDENPSGNYHSREAALKKAQELLENK